MGCKLFSGGALRIDSAMIICMKDCRIYGQAGLKRKPQRHKKEEMWAHSKFAESAVIGRLLHCDCCPTLVVLQIFGIHNLFKNNFQSFGSFVTIFNFKRGIYNVLTLSLITTPWTMLLCLSMFFLLLLEKAQMPQWRQSSSS